MVVMLVVLAAVAGAGCAGRRPVLYSNDQLDRVGPAAAERDIADCKERAARQLSGRGHEAARDTALSTGTTAVIGAASGAAGGAVFGHAGRGAAAGAAGGAAAGLLHSLLHAGEPSPTYKNHVTTCLADRGYNVIGWE
jgi:hypothetical protein